MARTKLAGLVIIFASLTIASLFGVYYTHQLSTEEEKVTASYPYEHAGAHDYIAKLKPNTIYNNQTTLRPGEGTLYTSIVEYINVTLTYTFQSTLPANITIEYQIQTELNSPGKWTKKLTTFPSNALNFNGNTGNFSATLPVNVTQIEELSSLIDQEIGTYSSTYNLTVNPEIQTIAETELETINEPFNPNLTLTFTYRATEGDQISIENLQHTSKGTINQTEKVFQPSILNQRYISYIISIVSFTGLVSTTWFFTKTKPTEVKKPKPIEEIIAPHEEIIIDVAGEPSYKGQRATITMNSLEDLVNLADGLARPVLHLKEPLKPPSKKPTHVFYVLDGLTKYEYRMTAPSRAKGKAKPETTPEEENENS